MKFFKIFTVALAAVAFTACSDNDDSAWNTAPDVTVEMGSATASFKEGRGLVTIPMVVNGDANGNIQVTLAVEEKGAYPAEDDVHFFLTTKTIVIFPEDKTYNVEIFINDDDVINEPRVCDIKIESVKGAQVGAVGFTELTIRDNDSDFYDKFAGQWILETIGTDGSASNVKVNLAAFDEDEEGYNNYYVLEGLQQGYVEYLVYFFYDMASQTGYLQLPYGQNGGTLNFAPPVGEANVHLCGFDGRYFFTDGYTRFDWDETMTVLTATGDDGAEKPGWLFALYNGDTFTGYSWASYFVSGMHR